MSRATDLITEERTRQMRREGWTRAHDDQHGDGSLAVAGACYALHAVRDAPGVVLVMDYEEQEPEQPVSWPWEGESWKPKTPVRDLVRAAALIAAEIDRRLRAGEQP